MTENVERDIGSLKARVGNLEKAMESISEDIKAIRSRTDRASGFVMLVILCIPAAAGAAVMWLIGR